jgi:hypothetical protein
MGTVSGVVEGKDCRVVVGMKGLVVGMKGLVVGEEDELPVVGLTNGIGERIVVAECGGVVKGKVGIGVVDVVRVETVVGERVKREIPEVVAC